MVPVSAHDDVIAGIYNVLEICIFGVSCLCSNSSRPRPHMCNEPAVNTPHMEDC